MKFEKLLITCGGTGGHFYPGLAIAKAMQKRGGQVKLLLAGIHAADQAKIALDQGVGSVILPVVPVPKKSPVRYLFGLAGGFFLCRREIKSFKPQALLGMGSFTSLPAILAARSRGVPLYLHDGNAKVGRANRMLSRFARFLAGAFPVVNPDGIRCPVYVTGMPVRQTLIDASGGLEKPAAVAELNKIYGTDLDPELPTVLIFGGSQGAAVFNAALPEGLLQLNSTDIQVLHLTGANKLESTLDSYRDAPFRRLVIEKTERMELFLAAADIVFSRSGGSTVAELTLFGRPAVLIPFPFAAEDHQRANAEYLAGADAGIVLDNYDLSPGRSRDLLADFLADRERWKKRGENAEMLARPAAADDLLEKIESDLA
ncbi:MAG: UDP-N-acetylglucosamine--N-acetylmuramyl-(pentapeptide) pyrophosphoryl-undecaprenol N-acetylglucosamine transferase [Lentisphaeria bacterium]|nr:UDP-N-acetylglucosamine--N-acetylmuramyl-(pentapeptide) pyrophosphoryl-undecaprenol N-acetylglucosamine transferase [Lentisphaeria bacterium]